jgi:large subunit ribosomal protein L6
MSRLGKKPIVIPEKTEIKISGCVVAVKGPLGTLERSFNSRIEISVADGKIVLVPKGQNTETMALWGTTSAHLSNMVKGVNTPFQKKLIVEGIGFKSEVKGEELVLNLGFSHQVKLKIPKGLKVTAEKNVITVSGIDPEVVGGFAAYIRDRKKPEPYKGKGIRYDNEVIRRKQGKKTA